MGRAVRGDQPTGGAAAFELVHARILRAFPELVTQLGGDAAGLLRRVGLDVDAVEQGHPDPTYRQVIRVMDMAAAELRCPDFGLRLATMQRGGRMFGPLGLVMRNSHTFGDALTYVSSHSYAHSLAARIWLKPYPAKKARFVGHDILLEGVQDRSQVVEQIMLVGHLSAGEITGGYGRARRVHFRHQPCSPPKTYRAYFGCDVAFGQNEDGLFFAERDLDRPIVDPDAQAYRAAAAYIDAHFSEQRAPLHAQARGLVMQYLGTAWCTNDHVAAGLNLHPRTLHRRLKAEGTSFQQIKDEVRRDLMLYYLQQTDFGLARISEKLGFAEQSVMTRRCNRWLAASPTKVRARAR